MFDDEVREYKAATQNFKQAQDRENIAWTVLFGFFEGQIGYTKRFRVDEETVVITHLLDGSRKISFEPIDEKP